MRLNIHHFVVISVLAHAALFAVWVSAQSRQLIIPAADSSAPVMHVAFQAEDKPARPAPARHMPHHRVRPETHKTSKQAPVARAKSILTSHPDIIRTTPPAAKAQPSYQAQLRRSEIRDRVLSRIRTDLQHYFVYPLLAQRRGWQGQVVLAFSVEANGMIRNIHVATGSGYPILDTSAVHALSRVQQLYSTGDGIQGKPLLLQLPIIYRLQGG